MSSTEYAPTGLRQYVEIFRKHRRLALVAFVVVPVVAFVYSTLQPPAYEATAQVLLGRQDIASSFTGIQNPGLDELSDRPVQTQADLARVPEVIRRTLIAAKRTDLSIQAFLFAS